MVLVLRIAQLWKKSQRSLFKSWHMKEQDKVVTQSVIFSRASFWPKPGKNGNQRLLASFESKFLNQGLTILFQLAGWIHPNVTSPVALFWPLVGQSVLANSPPHLCLHHHTPGPSPLVHGSLHIYKSHSGPKPQGPRAKSSLPWFFSLSHENICLTLLFYK